jgi:tRNA A-37 threonylcarbamoyl transferase component Bud32/WD40 repeat protein
MQLAPGTLLGPYQILALIGVGGMGQVYRARDTRLERQVAIKVISDPAMGDDAALERFRREARAIAALTHPHICTLYDVGREGDVEFLVMECLEGETLDAVLGRRKSRSKRSPAAPTPHPEPAAGQSGAGTDAASALPYNEVLTIATQLSDALAAAHRAGIIHRDLKPGNVMLTPTGVKVLDFGLAKLSSAPHAVADAAGEAAATAAATHPGLVVGTLPYMAPEQVEGRSVDARTDIFALGGILYEMTTGRRAFAGESPASLIASILEHDPQPLSAAQAVPAGFERLVRKCLAKDPNARWQSASDVADELRWLASGAGSGPIVGAAPRAARHRARAWGVAAAVTALVAVGSLGLWLWTREQRTTAPPPVAVHTQVTFAGDVRAAALSPDGRTVAFATGPHGGPIRIMARDLAGGHAIELWRGADVIKLQWLPDASSLLASGMDSSLQKGTWLVPRLGGVARRLPEFKPLFARSPDGSQIALNGVGEVGFSVVKTDGSVVRRVLLKGTQRFVDIEWSATADQVVLLTSSDDDGRSIVISATSEGRNQRQVYDDPLRITAFCSSPVADALYLLRERDDTHELLRVGLTGPDHHDARVLLTGLPVFEVPTTSSQPCNVSGDGARLLYMRGSTRASLWRLDLRRAAGGAAPLPLGTSRLWEPALSPDGQSLVAVQGQDIVKLSLERADVVRLGAGFSPVWSPDGKRLAFISSRSGPLRVWVSDVDGHHASEIKDSTPGWDVVWLPDGRIAWRLPGGHNYRIHDPASGQQELLMKESYEAWVHKPRFSPRGDQVALFVNPGTPVNRGLRLLSWPARDERFIAEGLKPLAWAASGEWIYASGRDRSVFRVSPSTGKTELLGSVPTGSLEACTISADASVAVCSATESSFDAWVVEHFDPEVRAPMHR